MGSEDRPVAPLHHTEQQLAQHRSTQLHSTASHPLSAAQHHVDATAPRSTQLHLSLLQQRSSLH